MVPEPLGSRVRVCTHDLNLGAAYADRICLLHGGNVVTSGEPWPTLREDVLERVFGQRMVVSECPGSGSPLVVPLRVPAGASR